MSLIDYAKNELAAIGYNENDKDPMNSAMYRHIMHMVEEFSKEGHSGFSASYSISILKKLLNYEPLKPLTGLDDEWIEIADGRYQNKRCFRVFKANGRAYDIEGKVFQDKDGNRWTNIKSRVYISFPYTPKTKIVKRRWWKFWWSL